MNTGELIKYFSGDRFIPQLQSNTKDDVLKELVKPLLDLGVIKNKNVILETLKKRETLGSTGIGHGIAIPHCRTLAVQDVQVVIGISKDGVEYNAIDEKPVYLFFLIAAPPQEISNQYLPILGKIVEMLRSSKTRKALMNAASYDELMKAIKEDN